MNNKIGFAEMLRYLRKREGLSQAKLAKMVHVAPTTIASYEQGVRHPDFETEQAIADTFNVSLDVLRGITEEILDRETEEMVKLFHKSSPEMRKAALAVLKSGLQTPESSG